MGAPDRRAGVWFDRPHDHGAALTAIRAILLDTELDEAFKWRGPCYTHAGGNICFVGDMGGTAVLSFFRGVLLTDPSGLLRPVGPNSRSAMMMRFETAEDVTASDAAIRAFVDEACDLHRRGVRPEMPPDDLDLPEELTQALDADPALADAWRALTPGRRRGYVVHVSGAKQSETRARRIGKHAPRILAGKGIHDD